MWAVRVISSLCSLCSWMYFHLPSVLWRCWLGGRKGIRPVKNWAVGCWCVVVCLEQRAGLHMAQLMSLLLTVSCFSKIQIGFTFLVPAHLGSLRKRAVKRARVRACVCVYMMYFHILHISTHLVDFSVHHVARYLLVVSLCGHSRSLCVSVMYVPCSVIVRFINAGRQLLIIWQCCMRMRVRACIHVILYIILFDQTPLSFLLYSDRAMKLRVFWINLSKSQSNLQHDSLLEPEHFT